MPTPILSPTAQQHLRRLGAFALLALVLGAVTYLHDALVRGTITVPPEWQPYVPLTVIGLGMLIMAMTPQLIKLRAAALEPPGTKPATGDEIAAAVVDSLASQVEAVIARQFAAAPVATPPDPATVASVVTVST